MESKEIKLRVGNLTFPLYIVDIDGKSIFLSEGDMVSCSLDDNDDIIRIQKQGETMPTLYHFSDKKQSIISELRTLYAAEIKYDSTFPDEEPKEQKALRYNDGKLKWSLVHFESLEPMVRVLMFGAGKYSPDNWRRGLDKKEILESMMRHLVALMDGEKVDSESGVSHMGHIQCNAMFYNYFDNYKTPKI